MDFYAFLKKSNIGKEEFINTAKIQDLRSRDGDGNTILSYLCAFAANHYSYYFIKLLLKRDPVLAGIPNNFGQTPLIRFCEKSNNHLSNVNKIINELINTNMSYPNAQDMWGYTALMYSIVADFPEACKSLLSTSANLNLGAQNNIGYTALMYACINYNKNDNINVALKIIKKDNFKSDAVGNDGNTALIIASRNKLKLVIEALLDYPNIKSEMVNNVGKTALMYICINGYTDIVGFLINNYDCNLHAVDNDGNTAFIYACKNGHDEIAMMILDAYNTNMEHKNKENKDALFYAEQNHLNGVLEQMRNLTDPATLTLYALKSKIGNQLSDTEAISDLVDKIKSGGKKRQRTKKRHY